MNPIVIACAWVLSLLSAGLIHSWLVERQPVRMSIVDSSYDVVDGGLMAMSNCTLKTAAAIVKPDRTVVMVVCEKGSLRFSALPDK